jgi:hypothetical protein
MSYSGQLNEKDFWKAQNSNFLTAFIDFDIKTGKINTSISKIKCVKNIEAVLLFTKTKVVDCLQIECQQENMSCKKTGYVLNKQECYSKKKD